MFTQRFSVCACLLLALAPALTAAPHQAKPVPPAAPAVPDTPAVAVVRQYVAARLAGQEDAAYALLSPNTQAQMPAAQREQMAQPDMLKGMPPSLLPVLALFADIHNTLHFKFRALGLSPQDPNVVLVRAYQVGMPLDTIKTLQVVTVPDPAAGGALRLDAEKTAILAEPGMLGMRAKAQQASSQSNLKQIALGIIQYVQDHDEKLPDADTWVDEVYPYVKSESVFRDPAAPAGEKWSYAYNRNLSGAKLLDLAAPAATVMLFESTTGAKNASDTGASIPKPGRHNGGTDYAFSDGHVKWQADGASLSFLLTGK